MAVNKFPDEVEAIRNLLAENPDGMSIKAIASLLSMNRNSVAKYLDMLHMQGRVTIRRYGSAKFYSLANILPIAALMKLSSDYVVIFSQGFVIVDMNEAFLKLLRSVRADIIGKPVREVNIFTESFPDITRLLSEGLKGREIRISAVLVLPDRSLAGTFTFSPVFFENGDPGVALIADITAGPDYPSRTDSDTCRSLIELDESEYICRFRPDGTITYANRAFADLMQKSAADLIGYEWRPFVPDREFKKIRSAIASLTPVSPVASQEFKVITPKGESRWQRWKFRGEFGPEGQATGYQGTGIDITDKKILEDKVQKTAGEMERLVQEHNAEIQMLNRQMYAEISSREKADFQLQFTQFAMNNASYLIIWISLDARFVYMNKKARQVLGYSYQELMTKKFPDLLAENLPSPWMEIWETTKRDHQFTFETAIRTRDGHGIPVEIVLNFLEFKEKQYCCCFATDITRRKLADEALRENEEQYRSLVESLPQKIFVKDADSTYISCNRNYATDLKIRPEEIVGKTDYDFYPRDLAEKYRADDRELILTGKTKEFIEQYEVDWQKYWVNTVKTPLRDVTGNITGILGIFWDTTENKQTRDALIESEEKYRKLIETTGTGYVILDRNGRVMTANEEYLRLTGRSALEEIKGRLVTDWTAPHDMERYSREVEQCLRKGYVRGLETDFQRPDGSVQPVEINASVIRSDTGKVILTLCRDITERRKAREALRLHSQIVENLAKGVAIVRARDGIVVYANPRFERTFGYAPDELTGKHFSSINAPDKRSFQEIADEIMASLRQKGVWSGDVQNIRKDGTTFWCQVNVSAFQDPIHGQVWISMHEDITGSRKDEEMMQEREGMQ